MSYFKEGTASERSFFLRLRPIGSNYPQIDLPLFFEADIDAESVMLNPYPGCVGQDCKYEITLLAPADIPLDFCRATLVLNGEELPCARVGKGHSESWVNDSVMYGYELEITQEGGIRPFNLVCGYARMDLALYDDQGRRQYHFFAKDIACQQESSLRYEDMEGMLDSLMGDPAFDQALCWMLSGGTEAGGSAFSLVEGGFERNSRRSPLTYLTMVEEGLNAAEAALPLIVSHGASRIQGDVEVVESSRVRRMGSTEAQWLAAHPEVLQPSSVGCVGYRGCAYQPQKMASVRNYRSFDVYENQLVLSYLNTVVSGLATFCSDVEKGIGSIAPLFSTVEYSSQDRVLALCVGHVLRLRQERLICKAEALKGRAQRLFRSFQRALPGVEVRPLGSIRLIRTKIFKQIQAYSRMYVHIERLAYYGETIFANDGLAIEALRLDRIYEIYVLYRLLSWFVENHYVPDSDANPEGSAIYAGSYGYTSRVYSDEPHVSNVYHLRRGSTKVSLYYEPVAFSGKRQEHGMSLHRLNESHHDVYTPDFVLIVNHSNFSSTSRKQVFVLDAKYRSRFGIVRQFANRKGELERSSWQKISERYIRNLVDVQTGSLPNALWLLCGVQEEGDDWPQIARFPAAPWEELRDNCMPSGLALVTPRYCLDDLFIAMGFTNGGLAPEFVANEYVSLPNARSKAGTSGLLSSSNKRPNYIGVELNMGHRFVSEPTPVSLAREQASSGKPTTSVDAPVAVSVSSSIPAKNAALVSLDDSVSTAVPSSILSPSASSVLTETLPPSIREKDPSSSALLGSLGSKEERASVESSFLPGDNRLIQEKSKQSRKSARQLRLEEQARKKREQSRKKQEKKARKKKERQEDNQGYGFVQNTLPVDVAISVSQDELPVEQPTPGTRIVTSKKDNVEELVLKIVEHAPNGDTSLLFDFEYCRSEFGINKPLLRKGGMKDYIALSGYDDAFYYKSKLPTYVNALRSYVNKRLK